MKNLSIDDLLKQLEDEEKTAEAVFNETITEEDAEKVAETSEEGDVTVASDGELTVSGDLTVTVDEEKVATVKETNEGEVELVKIATEMGEIMATSCYDKLVSLGVMPEKVAEEKGVDKVASIVEKLYNTYVNQDNKEK